MQAVSAQKAAVTRVQGELDAAVQKEKQLTKRHVSVRDKHEYVRSQELLPQTARVCGLEEKLRAVEERVSA